MEATFFTCARQDAIGVAAIDDLPCEPAGEAVRIESTGILIALARALGGDDASPIRPLRDATCRSFPVFEFPSVIAEALATLPEYQLDDVAQSWLADASFQAADVDLYEISSLLGEIRQALRDAERPSPSLFVLLEEKAI